MITYQQAVANQWPIAYHRMTFARENERPCKCERCIEHLEAMKTCFAPVPATDGEQPHV